MSGRSPNTRPARDGAGFRCPMPFRADPAAPAKPVAKVRPTPPSPDMKAFVRMRVSSSVVDARVLSRNECTGCVDVYQAMPSLDGESSCSKYVWIAWHAAALVRPLMSGNAGGRDMFDPRGRRSYIRTRSACSASNWGHERRTAYPSAASSFSPASTVTSTCMERGSTGRSGLVCVLTSTTEMDRDGLVCTTVLPRASATNISYSVCNRLSNALRRGLTMLGWMSSALRSAAMAVRTPLVPEVSGKMAREA